MECSLWCRISHFSRARRHGGIQPVTKLLPVNRPSPKYSALLYTKVQTQALTNFLARAWSLGQKFSSAKKFFDAVAAGSLKEYHLPDNRWLPQTLLTHAARRAPRLGTWRLAVGRHPELICRMADGTRVIGMFRLSGHRIRKVWVKVQAEGGEAGPRPADGALGTVAQ